MDSDAYVLRLCVYIHLNPVKAGLVEKPEDWTFSNYLEWVGRRGGTLVDREFVREHSRDGVEYEAFVREEAQRWREAEMARYLDE